MKIPRSSRQTGSVLLATMVFVLAIAAFMAAYLFVVGNSNQSVHRAEAWNSALPITEAGIEEGMANLNQAAIVTDPTAASFSPFTHDLNGGAYYVGSSAKGVVSTIISTGIVSAPINGDAISRIVRVVAQRQALFIKGVVSMTDITFNGSGPNSGIVSSSWNSHDPNQSLNGVYNGYNGTNGDVAAVNGFVNIGNHTIEGNLYLGPNSGWSSGPNGKVTGTVYSDWNMQFPSAALPTADTNGIKLPGIWPDAPGSSSLHTITNSGYYTIRDSGSIVVGSNATVVLDVKVSSYSPSGITINGGTTTNAGTLIMYQESGTLTLSGSAGGGAYNSPPTIPSNRPENFRYFGLSGVTSLTFKGSSTFIGIIYAPGASLTLSGGGSSNDFIGGFIVGKLAVNGHYNFHFDTSLTGLYYGYYVVGSWQEL